MQPEQNIVLIGMPGVGKSTIGVLLAKRLSWGFIDTDVYIQSLECRRLQDIIDDDGVDRLRILEERYVLSLDPIGHVIATGGSVIYSGPAMEYLKSRGFVVLLDLPYEELERRVSDLDQRGVVRRPSQSLYDIYQERMPCYRQFADAAVACGGKSHEEVVEAVLQIIPA